MNTDGGFFPRGPTSSSAGLETKTCPVSEDLRNVPQSGSNAILKVKRRKTKRERNNAKFHKSEAEKFPKKVSRYFLQKQNSAFHSFCLGTVQPAAIKGACGNSNPVIITQNRLSQHLGMFNREVKSVDIGRLLSQDQRDKVDGDINESTADVENIDPRNMAVDPDNTPRIESQENLGDTPSKLMGSETKTQVMEPSSDLLQTKDQEDCISCGEDSSVHQPTTPASSGATTRTVDKQDIPVQEVAEMIIKTLNPQVLFPGRDLLNETRKSIMEKVMQYRTSNTSARRRLDYSSTVNVDICDGSDWGRTFEEGTEDRSSGADPQITKPAEPKTSTPFLSPSGDNASHTIIKRASDAHSHKKPTELFHQPITFTPDFDRQGLYRCRRMYDAGSPRVSTWPRAEPELAFDNRSRLQRDTESFLKSMRQRKSLDSHGTAGRPQERWKRAQDDFQVTAPHASCSHQHGSRDNSSPNLWDFPVGVPLQEIFPNHEAQAGLKIRHGSGGENQTSYDVLSSIWSHDIDRSPLPQIPAKFPDVSPKQTRLCYGDRSQQRVRSGGKFHTFRGLPPGDFEPQPSIGLSDFMFEDGEGQQQSDVQKHGAQGLETDMRSLEDPPPPTTLSQWRGIFEASRDEPWSPTPAVNVDRVDDVWSRDWRRSEQWSDQLPITLFPPSESLEQENPSVSLPFERSFRQTQLGRLSPDNWVFPRMKLY